MYKRVLDDAAQTRLDVIFDDAAAGGLGKWIPTNPDNADYQEYLLWAAINNVNDIADLDVKQ